MLSIPNADTTPAGAWSQSQFVGLIIDLKKRLDAVEREAQDAEDLARTLETCLKYDEAVAAFEAAFPGQTLEEVEHREAMREKTRTLEEAFGREAAKKRQAACWEEVDRREAETVATDPLGLEVESDPQDRFAKLTEGLVLPS